MTKGKLKGACVLIGLASSSAFAQSPAVTQLQPERVQRNVISSPIDTRDFFVQIDETYNYQPIRPENPIDRFDPKSKPNNLPVGKLLSALRGQSGPQFPAIGATGWTPPDPDIAVGPNHILAVVNSSLAWFTKAGVKQVQQTSSTFFTGMGAGTFQFDPKAFYDRANGRYVLVYLEQDGATETSKLLVAVSDDNDPNGVWYRYRIEAKITLPGPPPVSYWLDYPGFGYNRHAYVVSGNMFGFTSGFAGVQFIIIPTVTALTGAPVTVTSIRHSGGASAQVAEMVTDTESNIYSISRNGGSAVRLYSINNPGTTPTVSFTSITVPTNSGPTTDAASTSGRFLDTIDGRVFNATWRNNKLVTAHNIQNGSFVGSRWYELNTNGYPSGTPTLVQSGNITSGTQNYFCPAISVNVVGSIGALFTGSNSAITANLMFSGRAYVDSAGAMGAPQLLEASAGNNYAQGRWGDYFGVDVDPVDDTTFWGLGTTVAANNSWTTSIFSWTVPAPAPIIASLVLNPATVVGGSTSIGTVTLNSPAPFGGKSIKLASSSSFATVPGSIFIPAGEISGTFTISTVPPPGNRSTKIVAADGLNEVAVLFTVLL